MGANHPDERRKWLEHHAGEQICAPHGIIGRAFLIVFQFRMSGRAERLITCIEVADFVLDSPDLSSDARCNTPCRFDIGSVDQDLRECCDASLFTFIGRGKRPNRHHEGGRPLDLRHRRGASTSEIHRAEAGHWEGDLIICKRTRPVVLHERKSRVTLAARLAGKTAAETISVNPTLALKVTDAVDLRILLSIGPTETMHFQTWSGKAGNAVSTPLAPLTIDLTFPNLNVPPFPSRASGRLTCLLAPGCVHSSTLTPTSTGRSRRCRRRHCPRS
jgi:hypothetical protein